MLSPLPVPSSSSLSCPSYVFPYSPPLSTVQGPPQAFFSRESLFAVPASSYLQGPMFIVGGQRGSGHFLTNTSLVTVSVPKSIALFALTARDRQGVAFSAKPSGNKHSINLLLFCLHTFYSLPWFLLLKLCCWCCSQQPWTLSERGGAELARRGWK